MPLHQLGTALSFLLTLTATATLAGAAPAPRDFRDTLLALDQQFWHAAAANDVKTIGRLFADDYLGIDQHQNRWTRPDLLAQFQSVRTSNLRRAADPQVIRLTDDSAVLTYEASYDVHYPDRVVSSGLLRMSSCWAHRNGGWFVVFSQVSTIDAPAPAPAAPAPIAPVAPVAPDVTGREPAPPVDPRLPARSRPDAPPQPLLPPSLDVPLDDALAVNFIATLRDPDKTVFPVGDLIHVNLAVHNPTDRTLEGRFSTESAFYTPPRIEDADGNPVKVTPPTVVLLGVWALVPYRLAPNESKHVATATLVFTQNPPPRPPHDNPHHHPLAHAGPGHYRITWFNAKPLQIQIRNTPTPNN